MTKVTVKRSFRIFIFIFLPTAWIYLRKKFSADCFRILVRRLAIFVVLLLEPRESGTAIFGRPSIAKLGSKIAFKVNENLFGLKSLSISTLVRVVGDPIPYNPPIPYLPYLCDAFYHVGFGITLENFVKGRPQTDEIFKILVGFDYVFSLFKGKYYDEESKLWKNTSFTAYVRNPISLVRVQENI